MNSIDVNKFSLVTFLLSVIIGGRLFYKYFIVGIGFELIYLAPLFIIFSLLTLLVPLVKNIDKKHLVGLMIWLMTNALIALGIYSLHLFKDRSLPLIICEYRDDDLMKLSLRANKTYKFEHHGMMSSWQDYGTYMMDGNKIFLTEEIKFRMQPIKNPLLIKGDGIHFEFYPKAEEINGGGAVMWITYRQ